MSKVILPRLETPATGWRFSNRFSQLAHQILSLLKIPRAYGQRAVARIISALPYLLPNSTLARSHRRRTFQEVYQNKMWCTDGKSRFFSGVGSRGEPAAAYVDANNKRLHFADQGAGILANKNEAS